ncbi:MAG: AAA family ATPase [Phycisphaerae bacterium]|nr:AAA family ATPase [Phycisphaerae bacterium]
MFLKQVTMKHFCGFEEFTVEFDRLTVLVGPNNGGKTTILRSIKFALEALDLSLPQLQQSETNRDKNRTNIENSHLEQMERLRNEQSQQFESMREVWKPLSETDRERQERELRRKQSDALGNLERQFHNQIQQQKPAWFAPLKQVAHRLNVEDTSYFYTGRLHGQKTQLSLNFLTERGDISLSFACQDDKINIDCLVNGKSLFEIKINDKWRVIRELQSFDVELVPEVGALSPSEKALSWPNVQSQLTSGKPGEVWRNRIHWLNEGKPPESYRRVIERVMQYVPDVQLNPPSRTRDSQPNVTLAYSENGTEYDIAACGSGVRTLLALVGWIELSKASILLFDEPDLHLHSSIQRGIAQFLTDQSTTERQLIMTTHAPDMIDEFPLESLVWIDHTAKEAKSCDDIGKTLVALGATTHNQAMQSIGAKAIICFEDKLDRQVLSSIMSRCGKENLLDSCRLSDLKGSGDSKHLPNLVRLVKKVWHTEIIVATIQDADYTELDPQPTAETVEEVLYIKLPCKELENLPLLAPKSILDAAESVAKKRARARGQQATMPSLEEIEEKIDSLTVTEDIKKQVQYNWSARWLDCHKISKPDGGDLHKANSEFEKCWGSPEWRRSCCPGKVVLRRLKHWLQADYNISFGINTLFDAYEPSEQIRSLFDKLEEHIGRDEAPKG